MFRAPFESLSVELNLKESRLEIAQFDLRRKNDSFRGEANVDLTGERAYTFTFTTPSLISRTTPISIPEPLRRLKIQRKSRVGLDGKRNTRRRIRGHFTREDTASIRWILPSFPSKRNSKATIRPDNIFFRQFNLSNQHAAFNAFVTIAKRLFSAADASIGLERQTQTQGNIFLPLALSKLRPAGQLAGGAERGSHFRSRSYSRRDGPRGTGERGDHAAENIRPGVGQPRSSREACIT